MISQKCPKCRSSRIRRGYRPTPFLAKLIFRYNLLCDSCNLEFRGFAFPAANNGRKKKKEKKAEHQTQFLDNGSAEYELEKIDLQPEADDNGFGEICEDGQDQPPTAEKKNKKKLGPQASGQTNLP